MPPMKPEARQRNAAARARPARWTPAPSEAAARPDLPGRSTDRSRARWPSAACSASAHTSGPPTLPNYFYNNLKQIVQTKRHGADPERDGARRARRPHERASTCRRPSASGWAIRSAAGKATRSSSTPRTSRARRSSTDRAISCTSSSASRASTRTRSSIASPSRIRRRGIGRGPASIRGRRPTRSSTSTPATKATTRWAGMLRGARSEGSRRRREEAGVRAVRLG